VNRFKNNPFASNTTLKGRRALRTRTPVVHARTVDLSSAVENLQKLPEKHNCSACHQGFKTKTTAELPLSIQFLGGVLEILNEHHQLHSKPIAAAHELPSQPFSVFISPGDLTPLPPLAGIQQSAASLVQSSCTHSHT
jgi:hypothetical protein